MVRISLTYPLNIDGLDVLTLDCGVITKRCWLRFDRKSVSGLCAGLQHPPHTQKRLVHLLSNPSSVPIGGLQTLQRSMTSFMYVFDSLQNSENLIFFLDRLIPIGKRRALCGKFEKILRNPQRSAKTLEFYSMKRKLEQNLRNPQKPAKTLDFYSMKRKLEKILRNPQR